MKMKVAWLPILMFAAITHPAEEPRMLEFKDDDQVLSAHDPAMIRQDDTFYVFCTGGSIRRGDFIPIKKSRDLIHWESAGSVFQELPAWCTKDIPGTRGTWAPDVSYFNGRFYVYYLVSTFGKNNSAIGLVTNKTLDAGSPDYCWIDQGMVVRSTEGETDWNAIDPNLILKGIDKAWLVWGSFWSGIKTRRIDRSTGKFSGEDAPCILSPPVPVKENTRHLAQAGPLKRLSSSGMATTGINLFPLISVVAVRKVRIAL